MLQNTIIVFSIQMYALTKMWNETFPQVTDIPDTLIENHDIVVDYIVTPTKVIECEHRKKPSGIIWSKITRDKLQQVIYYSSMCSVVAVSTYRLASVADGICSLAQDVTAVS